MNGRIDAINRLLKQERIDPVETGGVVVGEAESLMSPESVRARLASFGALEGWLCFTDEVVAFSAGGAMPALGGRVVLYGELAAGHRSLHLRQDGAEWKAREIVRQPSGDSVVIRERFVPTRQKERPFAWVHYETFWQPAVAAGEELRPYVSRFAGFDTGEGPV